MAALDFPDNPATGDLYGSSGTVWRWDGARWASTAGASGARGRVAYAEVKAPQGSIGTTPVDIGGLSVTWTADPSRTYRTMVCIPFYSSIASTCVGVYILDAAGSTKQRNYDVLVGVTISETQTFAVVETGLSGQITRKVQGHSVVGGGTLTMTASGEIPAFILVEDITFEAGSSGSAPSAAAYAVGEVAASNPSLVNATWNNVAFTARQIISDPIRFSINLAGTQITVARAGEYLVTYSLMINVAPVQVAGNYVQAQVLKNASQAVPLMNQISGQTTSYTTVCGSRVVSLAAGDNIMVQCYPVGGASILLGDIGGRSYLQVSEM